MPRDKTILIRKGYGTPADGELLDGEPAIDITPTALRLFAGVGGTTDLLALPMIGGTLRGYLTLNAEPFDPLHAATRSYVDRWAFPEAPIDNFAHGRINGGWDPVLRLTGGNMTGGIGFSSQVGDTPVDLSKHLDLWGGQYGVNVSSGRLGVLSGMELALMCAGADILVADTGTINAYRPLYLSRDPLFGNEAATRAYVDALVGSQGPFLPLSGGTVSGRLTLTQTDGFYYTTNGFSRIRFETSHANNATDTVWVVGQGANGEFAFFDETTGLFRLRLGVNGNAWFPAGTAVLIDTAPIAANHAVRLFELNQRLALTGGTMTGALTLAGDAAANLHAVPLQQLNAAIAANPGPPGPQGPPGADSTVPGPAGPPGQDGAQGVQGEQGIPGNDGAQGIQGVPGNDGAQGIQGEQGIPGNDGAQGPQGVPGNDGAQGIQGDQGIPGIQGDQGIQGIQGDPGQSAVIVGSFGVTQTIATLPPSGFIPADWDAPGSPPNNYQMLQGQALVYSPANEADPAWGHLVSYVGDIVVVEGWVDVGNIRGPQGIQGIQGQQGIQGEVGPQGIQGNDGQQGIQGNPGNDGAQGPQGVPGNDGAQGVQGDQGIPGNDGAQGPQGVPGNDGAQGIQGEKGDQGDQGVPGVGFPDADADGFTYGRLNQAGWDRVLSLAGGTLNGGLSFGGAVAPGDNPTDLSNHITLHTAGYGFSVTGGRLNVVAGPGASIQLNVAGADRVLVSDTAMVVALPFQVVGAGIQYNGSGFANHVMGFGWDGGRIVGLVDGGPQGQLAYVSDIPGPPDLSGYLPTSGGTMNGFLIMNTAGISYPGVALGTASVIGFGSNGAGRIHAGVDGVYTGDLAYTSDIPDLTDLNNRVAALEAWRPGIDNWLVTLEARMSAVEGRTRLLEQAVRELQFKAWIDPNPAYIIPP